MNHKSNTLKSFSTESNQVSVKRITIVIYLMLGTFLVSPARSFQTQRENCEPVKQHKLNWTHCKHTKHRARSLRMIIDSNWLLGKATQASIGTLLTNLLPTDAIFFSLVNLYFHIINHIVCISQNLFILNLYLLVPLQSNGFVGLWAQLQNRRTRQQHCAQPSSKFFLNRKKNAFQALGSKFTLMCCLFPSQPPLIFF